jgi:hypothetical protein
MSREGQGVEVAPDVDSDSPNLVHGGILDKLPRASLRIDLIQETTQGHETLVDLRAVDQLASV